jgi:hypothetical protein
MRISLSTVLLACTLGAPAFAFAGPFGDLFTDYDRVVREGKGSHTVDIDNDSLLLKRDDGFYTSGMQYTRSHTLRETQATTYGWRIGQQQYTASDIKLPPALVGPPDHPYAGWLYGGFFKEVEQADGSHLRLGIDVGCIGPCAGGEWLQSHFHRLIDQPQPQGWSKQVRNEFGVVLYGDWAPLRWTPARNVDITPAVNGRFGNIFTDVGVGATLRAGRLPTLASPSTLHAFLRTDVHAVGYNATLQGGYFSSGNPHTVAPKRIVGEAEAGVAWNRGAFALRAGIVRRSNEIRDLPNSVGAQNYVRLQISYTP